MFWSNTKIPIFQSIYILPHLPSLVYGGNEPLGRWARLGNNDNDDDVYAFNNFQNHMCSCFLLTDVCVRVCCGCNYSDYGAERGKEVNAAKRTFIINCSEFCEVCMHACTCVESVKLSIIYSWVRQSESVSLGPVQLIIYQQIVPPRRRLHHHPSTLLLSASSSSSSLVVHGWCCRTLLTDVSPRIERRWAGRTVTVLWCWWFAFKQNWNNSTYDNTGDRVANGTRGKRNAWHGT